MDLSSKPDLEPCSVLPSLPVTLMTGQEWQSMAFSGPTSVLGDGIKTLLHVVPDYPLSPGPGKPPAQPVTAG